MQTIGLRAGEIKNSVKYAKVTVLVLIGFSNALNMVDHDVFLSILTHYMVFSEALEWFLSLSL